MHVEHHDLAHEFPEFKDKIHELKVSDAHFKKYFDMYQDVDKHICRIEDGVEVMVDSSLESLKLTRVHLKDFLYRYLQTK
ncbi:MAG TPA: DUF465 domain-containing protein [Myxococcota bacterium]|nr:DUF465 domain-containing protein [Myxococcota bacterium]HND31271.1 DUF465 domain-containing protein [Myxococcota bacterium]HNH45922.1 DUF465 domain-containing protein [Myxococcota bacterium]